MKVRFVDDARPEYLPANQRGGAYDYDVVFRKYPTDPSNSIRNSDLKGHVHIVLYVHKRA